MADEKDTFWHLPSEDATHVYTSQVDFSQGIATLSEDLYAGNGFGYVHNLTTVYLICEQLISAGSL